MMALTEEEAAAFKEMLADYAEMKEEREKKGKSGRMTKEEIMSEKDTLRRQKLIRENMDLFKN